MRPHENAASGLSRRTLILGGAALLSGCVRDSGGQGRTAVPQRPPRPSPSPVPPPVPPLYTAPVGDALVAFKQVAGRFVQGLATYDLSQVPAPLPAALPSYVGARRALVAAAAPLRLVDRWSRAEVEFVQYGGLSPVSTRATSGVALVVLRQVLESAGGEKTVVRRTVDVRLRRQGGVWRIDALGSAGGRAIARPAQVVAPAQQVLDDERIDLPDSARWDIYSGQISPNLFGVMLRLAAVTPLRITVLKTGHPQRVVDGRTSPPISDHWRGRAVDIHSLDGAFVADAPPALVRAVVRTAMASKEVSQVGAPTGFDLDGPARRGLTNLVHADHLHVAVRRSA